VAQLHDEPPGFHDFVGVTGAKIDESGHGAQRRELFDGLVGGSVFADSDGVMGEQVDDWEFHQRGEPDGAALDVGEDQEPGLVGADLAERQTVADRAGGVFADAEVQVPAGPVLR